MPSWYWEHKRMNIIDFSKDVYSIFENMKKCLDDKSIHSLQDLSNFMVDIRSFSETINDIFKLKNIKRNNDLGKTESDKTNKGFEKARDSRNSSDNNQLDMFRDAQRNKYNKLIGEYSRNEIIIRLVQNYFNNNRVSNILCKQVIVLL